MATDTSRSIILSMDKTLGISVVARENNDFYLKSVEMMLAKLMISLNVKNNITEQQVEIIPQLLLSEYPAFRLNDVWMVCKNIMLGKYKMFERLDCETFFRCVKEYDGSEERSAAFEEFNKRNHVSESSALNQLSYLPDEIKNEFKKIGKGQTIQDAKLSMRRAMERYKQENEGRNE